MWHVHAYPIASTPAAALPHLGSSEVAALPAHGRSGLTGWGRGIQRLHSHTTAQLRELRAGIGAGACRVHLIQCVRPTAVRSSGSRYAMTALGGRGGARGGRVHTRAGS